MDNNAIAELYTYDFSQPENPWHKKKSSKKYTASRFKKFLAFQYDIEIEECERIMEDIKSIKEGSARLRISKLTEDEARILQEFLPRFPFRFQCDSRASNSFRVFKKTDYESAHLELRPFILRSFEERALRRAFEIASLASETKNVEYYKEWLEGLTLALQPFNPAITMDKAFSLVCTIMFDSSFCPSLHIPATTPVKRVSSSDEEYCFRYFPTIPDPGPTPNWDQLLERINKGSNCEEASKIFLAWLWGCLESENNGREALWLQGPGMDGKSTISKALWYIVGQNHVSTVSQGSYKENRFFFSDLYGKLLTIYGDNKNPRLISEGKIHSLLGQDAVPIEVKGVQAFSDIIRTKLLILSNIEPEISDVKHEISRLIYLKIAPLEGEISEIGDGHFLKKLIGEGSNLLGKARIEYQAYCKTDSNLTLPKKIDLLRRTGQINTESVLIGDFIEEYILEGSQYSMTYSEFQEEIAKYIKLNKFKMGSNINVRFIEKDIKKYVNNRFERARVRQGNKRAYIYTGVTLQSLKDEPQSWEALDEDEEILTAEDLL